MWNAHSRARLIRAIATVLVAAILPQRLSAEVSPGTHAAHERTLEEFVLQTEPYAPEALPEDLDVVFEDVTIGEAISLDEVTRIAVARSLDINIFRLDWAIELEELPIAESVYDTEVTIDGEYEIDEEQPASSIAGTRGVSGTVSTKVEKLLPTGTELTLFHEASRESTNSAFATLSRLYEGSAKLSVTQPILRNSFGLIDRAKVRLVELDVKRFDYETSDLIEGQVFTVRKVYWDLVFTHRDLEGKRRALRQAQEFLRTTKEKLLLGIAERQDVYAAEANVRLRVVDSIEAQTVLENRREVLQVLLDMPRGLRLVPSTEPTFEEFPNAMQESLEEAYQTRRDYRQLKLDLEKSDVSLRMKRSLRLPQLDLEASYRSHGLDRDLFDTQGEIGGFNHPTLFTGLTFSYPLENRLARAEYRQAKASRQRVLLELRRLERRIEQEIRKAFRAVRLAAVRVKQMGQTEVLQRKKLIEEGRAYELGRSDSRTIIDFQEDLIEAETEADRALILYQQVKDAFFRSAHRLLEEAGVLTP